MAGARGRDFGGTATALRYDGHELQADHQPPMASIVARWPEEAPRLAVVSRPAAMGCWRWWRGFYDFLYDFNRY